MEQVIFHIGNIKTGSSALQRFFSDNVEQQSNVEVQYPLTVNVHSRMGYFLLQYCNAVVQWQDLEPDLPDADENFGRIKQALGHSGRTLFSDENYFSTCLPTIPNGDIYDYTGRKRATWRALGNLFDSLGIKEVRIVLYLRRQDEALASSWRQFTEAGDNRLSLAEHVALPLQVWRHSYDSLIQVMLEELGKSCRVNLVIRRYGRNAFVGGDIYHDFCDASNIDWNNEFVIPTADENMSLSFDVAEALRSFMGMAPAGSTERSVLVAKAYELSVSYPDKPGTTPFSQEETNALMEPYLEGNRWISEQFFGGEPIFPETRTEKPIWVPNEVRIAEFRRVFRNELKPFWREHPIGALRRWYADVRNQTPGYVHA